MRRESDPRDEFADSPHRTRGPMAAAGGQHAAIESLLAEVDDKVDSLTECAEFLDGQRASEVLSTATKITSKLEAVRLKLISRIDSSGIWQADDSATPVSWLREHQVLDHRGAKSDVNAARLIHEYPRLSDAVSSGRLSRAHIDTIANIGLRTSARRAALADFLDVFVDIGESAPASVLRRVMRAWADQVDPLTTAKDEHEAHNRRYLNVNLLADGVFLEGFFDHEQGAKILAALNGAIEKSRRLSAAERSALEEGVQDADVSQDPRDLGPNISTSQQRADAFISGIIDPMLTSGGLPSSGGSRASVTVLVPLERLEQPCPNWHSTGDQVGLAGKGPVAAATDRKPPDGPTVSQVARQLELASPSIGVNNGPGRALLSSEAVHRLTCDCEVHRIVISPQGLPLDVGRTMRTFPAHLRKALNLRDGGCVFPGCSKPPGWAEAHHIIHWALGGQTSLQNSALLCSKHHHQVHAEGHIVEIGPDGRGRVLVGTSPKIGKRPRETIRL